MTVHIDVLGLDPGVNGGAALIEAFTDHISLFPFTGRSEQEIADWILMYTSEKTPIFLEKVGSMPSDGHVGAFTFGRGYGFLRGVIRARGLLRSTEPDKAMRGRVFDVAPQVWQARMGCLTGGNKKVSFNAAQARFGKSQTNRRITLATADALLIADYGREMIRAGILDEKRTSETA